MGANVSSQFLYLSDLDVHTEESLVDRLFVLQS